MGILNRISIALMLIISAYCLQATLAKSIQVIEDVEAPTKQEKTTMTVTESTIATPGRVHCEYTEPTDDEICQEHCLPKGYTFGICVSHTCSCI